MASQAVLAIDSGRSGTRLRLRTGEVTVDVDGPGIAMIVDDASLRHAIAELEGLFKRLPSVAVDATAAALAAFSRTDALNERLADYLARRTGSHRVVLTADCMAAHAGALGGTPGVVVAAGTGVVVSAVGDDGWTGITDSHGYLFGDRGSGFSIGLAGLRAAALGHDLGRRPNALLETAEKRFGPLPGWPARLQMPDAVPQVASFTRDVLALADARDPVAQELRAGAATDLAESAGAAVDDLVRRGAVDPVPLSWSGSLLIDPGLRRDFLARLTPRAEPREPVGSTLDGAVLLATTALAKPQPGLVLVHER